jgi:hypothetical protein
MIYEEEVYRIWPVVMAGFLSIRGAKAATEKTGPMLRPGLVGAMTTMPEGATATGAEGVIVAEAEAAIILLVYSSQPNI